MVDFELQAAAGSDGEPDAEDTAILDFYLRLRERARQLLRREKQEWSVGPTDFANEAWLRLQSFLDRTQPDWQTDHRLASLTLRRMIIDYVRRKRRLRRGGDLSRAEIELDQIVSRIECDIGTTVDLQTILVTLADFAPHVLTFVDLHFFGGLDMEECAKQIGVSRRTLERHWERSRAWLRGKFGGE
ncbi:MAG: sigma-70 family RNA polymerase sigma factor [Planctomycetota bacterium]